LAFGTAVELELTLSEDEVLLVMMASFEVAAAAGSTAFLTSEVLIGPFVILEVSDCDLVGVVAGLLEIVELDEIVLVGAFDAAAFAKLVGLIFVFEPLFTGLFVLLASSAAFSLVVLTLVSSTGVTSTSLMASLIVSVLDFCSS